jgi:nucleoside phosphorylase
VSDYIIVVPKQDELFAVEWAFGITLDRPDQRLSSGVELFRRQLEIGDITFALLDRQTNTYSSILTADVIRSEAPRLAFLVGTALGNPSKVPLGSVVVSDGVIDISERRYTDDGQSVYIMRDTKRSDALTHDANAFISRHFTAATARTCIRSMARKPAPLITSGSKQLTEFVARNQPKVDCEAIVSGNDYRMSRNDELANDLWRKVPVAYAYDMEAAGFALAADYNELQWLVVRGISDHGYPETKTDLNRQVAAGVAARFLAKFIGTGLVRAAGGQPGAEPATTIALLRDEAYRLDGTWHGVMAYFDDDGEPVIFEDHAELEQTGSTVQGLVKSRKIRGVFRHDELEYRTNFAIAKHGYAGGMWSVTNAVRRYFGVMLGQFDEDSTILQGAWLGTHEEGIRRGLFKWYNTSRDGLRNDLSIDSMQIGYQLVDQLGSEAPS